MDDDAVRRLLDGLASGEHRQAWSQLLDAYAGLILRIVRRVEWDAERRTDCFVFVCEELSRDRYRRLTRFDPARGAGFSTWLGVVVHNLCLDWHRKSAGRFRLFRSLAHLSALDEEIYRCVYQRGLTAEETRQTLLPDYPDLTGSRVNETVERVRQSLTPRQHWLLSMRRPKIVPLERSSSPDQELSERQLAGPGPDPEQLAALEERRERLSAALDRLADEDRLLVRLRFEQGLTLRRVAALAGMQNPQQADRRLRQVLALLRQEMEGGTR